MTKEQIVALGGGGFSMEETPVLDDYILGLVPCARPRICFVPTASGDNENYIVRFYRRFNGGDCVPSHLGLFNRDIKDLTEFALAQDVIYVGGGNTANMLAVWRLHGFDKALRAALAAGTILAGVSAGSICWFQSGVTDSFGGDLAPLDCLGFLPGSNCPHYDGEAARRPAYQRFVGEGMLPGIAADDGAAVHFVDGRLHRVVSSRKDARAYRVRLKNGRVQEALLDIEILQADAG
jgi:dipeptidase E